MCAPWRIGAFVSIELDQIVSTSLDGIERLLLRKAKRQSVSKRSPEHFLNADTISLLRLYIEIYRPMIMKHNKCENSEHLFPGRSGGAKSASALREQMTKFVRKNTSLKDWHPHFVRKNFTQNYPGCRSRRARSCAANRRLGQQSNAPRRL